MEKSNNKKLTRGAYIRAASWFLIYIAFYVDWYQPRHIIRDSILAPIFAVILAYSILDREKSPVSNNTFVKPKVFYSIIATLFAAMWWARSMDGLSAASPWLVIGLVLIAVAYLVRRGGKLDPDSV